MKAKSIRDHMNLADVYSAPGHLLRRSQQIVVAIFFEVFGAYEVTAVQYAALIAIRGTPGMDQRKLVNRIAGDRSTIGAMLKTLEERRLIARITPKQSADQAALHFKSQRQTSAEDASAYPPRPGTNSGPAERDGTRAFHGIPVSPRLH